MRCYKQIAAKLPSQRNMRIASCNSVHVSVASWNVLADSYAYNHQPSKDSSDTVIPIPTYIEWDFRKQKIAESISSCGADILCLQEVDHFADFYEPLLGKLGYKSVYLQRMKRKDGCLIAYNDEKYELHGVDEVQFDDLADYMDSESARSNMKRSNVALIAVMSSRKKPSMKFISSTAHMYWNPRRPEVKSLQTQYLVSRINSLIATAGLSTATPVFMAGDFNSVPFSEPYQLLVNGFDNLLLQKGKIGLQNVNGALYGPKTKFLCDRNLGRLCRWMRVLGIDTALIPDVSGHENPLITTDRTTSKINKKHKQTYDHIFNRARDENRVILTTSKTMRERSMCPPSFFVSTKNLEASLIEVCKEYGVALNQDNFLTVCGKCGGEIEACSHLDPRVSQNSAIPPLDREVFVCKDCSQPYWWNERENSSPARAMKMADKLFTAVTRHQMLGQETVTAAESVVEIPLNDESAGAVGGADGAVSFELSERITIVIQSTGIKEENIDAFNTVTLEKELEAAVHDAAYLTELFNKRDKTIRAAETNAIENDFDDVSSIVLKVKDTAVTAATIITAAAATTTATAATALADNSSSVEDTQYGSLLDNLGLQEDSPQEEEIVSDSLIKSSISRIYSSAYASVHGGREPEATNWSTDFKE